MEKLFMGMLIGISFIAADCSSQTTYTWNVSAGSSAWNTATNWTPNGVPTANDNVIIGNTANTPVYNGINPVKNFTINAGSFNLGGNNLIIAGAATFSGGNIANGTISPSGTNATFTNTTFNCNVAAICTDIYLNGGVFNNPVSIEKTGSSNNNGTGGITCNAATSLKNSGSGNLLSGNTSARNDVFNAPLTLTIAGGGSLLLAYNSLATRFNDDVTVNSTGKGYIYIGTASTSGSSSLNPTKTINVGTFLRGGLRLSNFTQLGNTAQNITLAGDTTYFYMEGGVVFNGNLTVTAPYISSLNSTFKGATILEKNGAANFNVSGGNTFNDVATLIQSGAGNWIWGNSYPDVFNADVTLINKGTEFLNLANNHAAVTPTQFNGNVIVNSYGANARGIAFCGSNGTCVLAAGKTITIGSGGFTAGELSIRHFTQTGNTPLTLNAFDNNAGIRILTGTTFNADVNIKAPHIYLSGAVYNGAVTFETTAATLSNGAGGNTFNGVTTFNKSGAGYFMTGQYTADVFNADLYLNNSADSYIYLAYGHPNITPTQFNGNIIVNSISATAASGILVGGSGTSSSTLAATKSLSVGASGFSGGQLTLRNLTQAGTALQALSFTGTAILNLSANNIFNGSVNFSAPGLTINQNTFNSAATLEKNGTGASTCYGGNIFNDVTTITVSGSGALQMGQTLADIFNSDLTVNNYSAAQSVFFGYSHPAATPTQFNGNVILNSTGTSAGISLGRSTATVILASGKTVSIGSSGFSSGSIRLRNFTQQGSTAQNLLLTGSATLTVGPSATFNGPVNFVAAGISLSGATYNSTAYFEKTGAVTSTGTGNNIFNGTTTIVNGNTSTNYFRNNGTNTFNAPVTFINNATADILFENTTGSIYNAPVTFNNNGISNIRVAYAGTNVFNDNVTVNTTSGAGIIFCESAAASAVLAAGHTLTIGSYGFNTGQLVLQRFTQSGNTVQGIILTGNALLQVGPASNFNGDVNLTAPQIMLNGCNYNGDAYFEKTGATSNIGTGNNIFNGTTQLVNSNNSAATFRTNGNNTFNGITTLNNTANADILLELSSGSTYNNDLIINNTGSSAIRSAYTGNTTFSGNVIVNNTGSYVSIGENAAAVVTMATGKTISIGNTYGFATGNFNFYHFTQMGSTPQSIVLTGSSTLTMGSATTFNGGVTITAPGLLLNGCTFNGNVAITKNGSAANSCAGGNVFNSTAVITASGTGNFVMAATSSDDFNDNVSFVRTGSGLFYPAYNANSTFAGDISTAGSTGIVNFSSSTSGRVTIDGNALQTINGSSSFPPELNRITINKAVGFLQLNVPVNIATSLTLVNGNITSSLTNLINFRDNATVSGASHASFVNGPVRKTGNDLFTFPVGKGSLYRPISITAPAAIADHFTAEYFSTSPDALYSITSKAAAIDHVSACEYWILNRTNGTSNVFVNLSWENYAGGTCSGINSLGDVVVARWNGSSWANHGKGTVTGNTAQGSVSTAAVVTSFSPFALASTTPMNPLPITLLDFKAVKDKDVISLNWKTATENNNDYFTVARSVDGVTFDPIGKVKGAGHSVNTLAYNLSDIQPLQNKTLYYQLWQTDYDGNISYSAIISLNNNINVQPFAIYPNPSDDGMVTIKCNNIVREKGLLYVTDVLGNIIYQQAIAGIQVTDQEMITVKLELATKGMYIVHFDSGDNIYTQKLLLR